MEAGFFGLPAGTVETHRGNGHGRLASFDEIANGLPEADAQREARRCLSCGCRKVDFLATQYDADVYRFAGARRRFSQDVSHPEIIYELGKCILCDACVRIAAKAGEPSASASSAAASM